MSQPSERKLHYNWVNILMMIVLGMVRFGISPLLGWSDLVNNLIFIVWIMLLVAVNAILYFRWKRQIQPSSILRK
jgi:hypothetical protein